MALYSVITPGPVEGPTFAVIADDTSAEYVFASNEEKNASGLDSKRIVQIIKRTGRQPTNAKEWLRVASTDLGLVKVNAPATATNLDAARVAALKNINDLGSTRSNEQDDTNQELMSAEDRLELALDLAGPVQPELPHLWLPINVTAIECAFCEAPENAEIHR